MQEYQITELPDGQRVVTERLDRVRSVAIGFWIATGSRDESAAQAGVSHFLEHLLFKGTTSYSAKEIAEAFDDIGGELNAVTTREYTVVYARVMDDHLDTALDVMTDMVYAPSIADIDAEREVVLEEIAMVEDAPQDHVHDLIGAAIFGRHALGRPVIGRPEVIETVSRRALLAYHGARYGGRGVVVSAAGRVDHDRLAQAVRAHAKRKARRPRPARPRALLGRRPRPRLVFVPKDTEQYHVCVGAPGIPRTDERRFAASLLDGILGGSASSRLFQEIREKRGLAYSVYTFASLYEETGELGVYLGTREENLGECLEIVVREIADVASGGVTPRELRRAKEGLKGRIMLSMESTSSRMNRLGRSLVTDTPILSLDDILAAIEDATVEDVGGLAGELLAPDLLSAAAIGPSESRFRSAVERMSPKLAAGAARRPERAVA